MNAFNTQVYGLDASLHLPVAVQPHEVAKDKALANAGAGLIVNSQEAVVSGATGKGEISVTVVRGVDDPNAKKGTAPKAATPTEPAEKAKPNKAAVTATPAATPALAIKSTVPAVGTAAPAARIGRGRSGALVSRQPAALTATPVAATPVAATPAVSRPTTTPKAGAPVAQAREPQGQKPKAAAATNQQPAVETKTVAVDLKNNYAQKLKLLQQGADGAAARPDAPLPREGRRQDAQHRSQMAIGGRSPDAAVKNIENGAPQIEAPGLVAKPDAAAKPAQAKPTPAAKVVPPTAKMAALPASSPRGPGMTQ